MVQFILHNIQISTPATGELPCHQSVM